MPPAPLQMVDTNILGPLAVTQAVVPHMAAQASGKIINVSHSSHRANGAASACVDVASHPALFTASACATFAMPLHPLHTSAMPLHSLHTPPPCHDSTPPCAQIGSILGFVTLPLAGLYCATKYAVRSLTEAMGFELAPFGIQVHGLEHPASSQLPAAKLYQLHAVACYS